MTIQEIKDNQEKFLEEYQVHTQFVASKLNWDSLMELAEDFDNKRPQYETVALNYVKEISSFNHIHSIKYRIKKTDSFIKKVILKSYNGFEINMQNYMTEITDLIGIRVLYIFKSDYLPVHEQIWKAYNKKMTQDIHIKLREGDDEVIYANMKKYKPVFEPNKTYRSIHYTMQSSNDQNSARMEIQTRTIFEEGWSEINHKLVYKNEKAAEFYFLTQASKILSMLVGDCDTLGDLMKNLYDEYLSRQKLVITGETDKINNTAMLEIMDEFLHNRK